MNLFVLSFDYHTFSKKDIPDVIQISTFVHFIFVGSFCICLHLAKILTGFKTSPNNMHQHAMRVCKQMQHATLANNVRLFEGA